MNVGSISRSQALDTTQPLAPASSPDTAPIDLSRDVADHGPSVTTHDTSGAAAIARPPAARVFVDPQIHRAAEAFARGGLGGLDTFLQQHPADARWLLSVSRDELTAGLRADLATRPGYGHFLGSVEAYRDAAAIDAHLADVTQPQIREAVRQVAVGRIDAMSHALESTPIDAMVQALRSAPAGSPLAELRTALDLPGNSMDRERVEHWVRTSREELHALRDTVMGQSWMPEEFPGSMAAVQRTMGLERATPGSIAGEALFRGHHGADARAHAHETAIDTTLVAAEGTEVALHAAHVVAHGGLGAIALDTALVASTGGVGIGLAGLAFGYALHHQIEHDRAERTETAAALGL